MILRAIADELRALPRHSPMEEEVRACLGVFANRTAEASNADIRAYIDAMLLSGKSQPAG